MCFTASSSSEHAAFAAEEMSGRGWDGGTGLASHRSSFPGRGSQYAIISTLSPSCFNAAAEAAASFMLLSYLLSALSCYASYPCGPTPCPSARSVRPSLRCYSVPISSLFHPPLRCHSIHVSLPVLLCIHDPEGSLRVLLTTRTSDDDRTSSASR